MKPKRNIYTLRQEPRDDAYRALLLEGARACKLATLVQRKECAMDPIADAILRRMRPFLRSEREVSEWPGTRLLDRMAVIREYDLSAEVCAILSEAAGLYDWCQPSRPEDLILWRTEDDPWLVTIAHEQDAFFSLERSEADELRARLPILGELWERDDRPE